MQHSPKGQRVATQQPPVAGARAAAAVDRRPEAAAQRQLLDVIEHSPRVAAQRQLSAGIDGSPRMAAQRRQAAQPAAHCTTRPVIQGRWVRVDGREPAWKDDALYPLTWFDPNLQTVKHRVTDKKKKKGYYNETTQVPETRFTPTSFGSLPVYKVTGAIAPNFDQLELWIGQWGRAKATAIFGAFDVRGPTVFGRVERHAPDIGTMPIEQVMRIVSYAPPKAMSFLRLLAGQLAPRMTQMDAWAAAWGPERASHIFGTYNMAAAGDFALIGKHSAEFDAIDESIIDRMMQRQKPRIDTFLDVLAVGELHTFFQGSLPRSHALVGTDGEFASLSSLARRERAFGHAQVLPQNPTAKQGAHHLSEHGAHNTDYQTVVLAVEYAMRSPGPAGGASTKGNWVSNEVAEFALQWAKNRTTLEIQAAALQNTAAGSLAHLPNTFAPGNAPIFGTPGTPTANIYNRVAQILGAPADYEHADVSGTGGHAQAAIQGDFTAENGALTAGAYGGAFTGRLTGAPLANGVVAANQPLRILDVSGSANVAVTLAGTAGSVGGQNRITPGLMEGVVTAPNAHVSFKTGVGPTVRYFDGVGNYSSMVSANVNPANSTWSRGWSTVTGSVHTQALNDGCLNAVQLPRATLQGPKTGNVWGVGSAITGQAQAYSPGTRYEINAAGASKASNLLATLTNHVAGPAVFQPDSLQQIVGQASLAGNTNSYKRPAPSNASVTGQLLAPDVTITGTLATLQGAGLPPHITDLSNLSLSVAAVKKGYSYVNRNFTDETEPVAGRHYNIQIGNEWHTFRLATYNPAPGATSFRALLYLKNQAVAEYEPFTGYPT